MEPHTPRPAPTSAAPPLPSPPRRPPQPPPRCQCSLAHADAPDPCRRTLMSRWMMPCRCRYSSALSTSFMIVAITGSSRPCGGVPCQNIPVRQGRGLQQSRGESITCQLLRGPERDGPAGPGLPPQAPSPPPPQAPPRPFSCGSCPTVGPAFSILGPPHRSLLWRRRDPAPPSAPSPPQVTTPPSAPFPLNTPRPLRPAPSSSDPRPRPRARPSTPATPHLLLPPHPHPWPRPRLRMKEKEKSAPRSALHPAHSSG